MDGLHVEDTSSFEAAGLSCIVAECERFESRWRNGAEPRIEDFLEAVAPSLRRRLLHELLTIEVELRVARGESPAREHYLERSPDWASAIESVFARDTFESPRSDMPGRPTATIGGVLDRGSSTGGVPDGGMVDTVDHRQHARPGTQPAGPLPERFGRYAVLSLLGRGGFGSVYLAHDEELGRDVAIKVLHPGVLGTSGQVESFLSEARLAAGLAHPGIVRVYDVGRDGDGEAFVVFEYVEGRDLAVILKADRPSPVAVAGLLARVAEAASHAHAAGLVHRDLKPSNILVDLHGMPHIADFGLAVHEDAQHLLAGEIAGTPAFMAPEQIRGETHRLDGRTDVWAMGVILYLSLTGRPPFRGKSRAQVFRAIIEDEPRPLRRVGGVIPRELERICLKCLAKRMSDRYGTSAELADDLKNWLLVEGAASPEPVGPAGAGAGIAVPPSWRTTPPMPAVPIVPRGLRAFDPDDADFFPRLVPGPRDREGLPEAIRTWRLRIEEPDPARSFSVGLIYGPSGGGKSSLVRAGLIPRLARWIRPVYVEAAAEGTEARLLAAMVREVPGLPEGCGLAEAAAALREGRTHRGGSKVLVVLDQFEQWLHAHPDASDGDLVRALRQCDGAGLQALLLVRDDFWMAITRFLRVLEVRPIEGFNASAVEPFDARHAARVLAELGRALGKLHDPATPDEARFIERAVKELAGPDGRIIPVRLTLLAEMLRHREWTSATLRELGGFEGIGVMFLEQTFGSSTASPSHRMHQLAAQAVLKALLPEPSSDLKGRMRSASALREVAGYVDRPADFDELMALLDVELRMVTPVDPSSADDAGSPRPAAESPPSSVLAAVNGSAILAEAAAVVMPSASTPVGVEGGGWRVEGTIAAPSASTTSPASIESSTSSGEQPALAPRGETYYQLTHDYLVPPVRQWLTRKQRETQRGRAELQLATVTALWRERPERRRLPSLWEWLKFAGLTRPAGWSDDERRMMRAATRYHLLRVATSVLIAAGLVWAIVTARGRERAGIVLNRAVDADYRKLPELVPELESYRDAVRPALLAIESDPSAVTHRRDIAGILLYRDRPTPARAAALRRRLVSAQAQPEEVAAIRGALAMHRADAGTDAGTDALNGVVADEAAEPAARLRAACALQAMEPGFADRAELKVAAPAIAEALLAEHRRAFPRWLDLLGPSAETLAPPLGVICGDPGRDAIARTAAAEALGELLSRGGRDLTLARVVVEATPEAAKVLLAELAERGRSSAVLDFLGAVCDEVAEGPQNGEGPDGRRARQDKRAARQAAAAIALAALGDPESLWSLLRHRHDPRARSLLVHRLAEDVLPARILIGRLSRPDLDPIEMQAILLAWAESHHDAAPPAARLAVVDVARDLYVRHAHPGVHAAAGLLLRRQGDAEFLARADTREPHRLIGPDGLGWMRGPNHQTFAILPGPLAFRMGSPDDEPGRLEDQVLHYRKIDRSLAVSMTEVTFEQLRAFDKGLPRGVDPRGEPGRPAINIDWFQAVRYCNWLSREAGIDPNQWCYPEPGVDGVVVPADAIEKEGYRLPTEAEWEYICRAGTETARYFGESPALLSRHAWTWLNSGDRVHPVGQLLPNEFGMFDMLGNVWEWCHDGPPGAFPAVPIPAYPPGTVEHPAPDPGHREAVLNKPGELETWRIVRGGAFNYSPVKARSAHRDWIGSRQLRVSIGFRVVRTLRPPMEGTAPVSVTAPLPPATPPAEPRPVSD